MLDIPRLKEAIRTASEELKKLKNEIRVPGHNISYSEAYTLCNLKHHATVFYTIRAFSRGRCHIKPMNKYWLEEAVKAWDMFKLVEVKEEEKQAA